MLYQIVIFSLCKTATYVYDGAGNKLSVVYYTSNGTAKMDYAGNKVYNNDTLGVILTEEGYVTPGTTPTYYYYLKDHQGNNRVVINQGGTVQQVNLYDAFGGLFEEVAQTVSQRYRYNDKELDTELGLNMYDYGARHYNAALGWWFTVDPMVERYYSICPFVYVANNPANAIDPDGKKIIFVNGYLGFGSPREGSVFWGGINSSFVRGVKMVFNDNDTPFFTDFDYSISSGGYDRIKKGYAYTQENYVYLKSGMDPEKDVFRIVSHSMGGTFSDGIIDFLKEKGWVVETVVHFNSYEPNKIKKWSQTILVDATNTNDWVQWWGTTDGNRNIPNADFRIRKKSEKGWQYRHRDLIDDDGIWNTNNGSTWNQALSILQSWLQQNPEIKINYGN